MCTVLYEPCYTDSDVTLFCHKLKLVAKYVFFVLFLGLKFSSVLFCMREERLLVLADFEPGKDKNIGVSNWFTC